MPLTLVTGPANAAKAGEVLGGLRSRLDDEPILVVPSFGDVEHAQRELAERGAVFGASVLRFDRLFGEIARRAGHSGRVASDVQRELIVEDAVRRARLDLLSKSAAQPGFVRAAARFVAELGRSMVEPARFTRALRDWAGDGPRRQYAEEVAAIYRGYRAGLDAAGLADPELFAWRALDALRLAPESWGATPLFVYGFDDFDPLQRDALETIAGRCGADVSVSLPFEPGRAAFKAVASAHQELLAAGAREKALPPLEDHYAAESRAPLHHVERHLFEDDSGQPCVEAGDAIAFHVAGGQRAEIELVGARLLELLRAGVEPGDIAVVLPPPRRLLVLARAGLRRLRDPLLARPPRALWATPAWGAACWHSCAAERSSRRLPRTTCSPGFARRACSTGPSWPIGSSPRSAARAPTPPRTRAGSGSPSAGRSASWIACAPPARTLRRSSQSSSASSRGSSPAPTTAAPRS